MGKSEPKAGGTVHVPVTEPYSPGSGAWDDTAVAGEEEEALYSDLGTEDTEIPFSEADDFETLPTIPRSNYLGGLEIARGGMGRIVRTRDRRLGRVVVVKEMIKTSRELELRFEREIRITARLQHPNIVSIHEAGRWDSGETFYAMKWIAGRSLESVIDTSSSLDERLSLLPNISAVADALAYAHERQVIHRDLKPANVLVGDFGETVVIDWGLAKDLREEESIDDPMEGAPSLNRQDVTIFGHAMGTPAYMPPEQARGEPSDERADVYALGAILHHLLSGKPPYSEDSFRNSKSFPVLDGPPTRLRSLEASIPPELLTIVEKSMERDPAKRYPSAREFGEDLRRYLAGQRVSVHSYSSMALLRRFLGRHKTSVAVACFALVALIVALAASFLQIASARDQAAEERDLSRHAERRADEARARAIESRSELEGLLNFMLTDLRDKLQPIGRVDILGLLADKASTYFEANPLDRSRLSDIRMRSLALENISEVHILQGKSEQGLAELAASKLLLEESPESESLGRERARIHQKLAHHLIPLGDIDRAQEEAVSSLAQLEAVLAEGIAKPSDVRATAKSMILLGGIRLRKGEADQAIADFHRAQELLDNIGTDDSQLLTRRYQAKAHYELGRTYEFKSDSPKAKSHFRRSKEILESFPLEDGNVEILRELAGSYDKLAEHLAQEGNLLESTTVGLRGLELSKQLALQNPRNTLLRRDLSVTHEKIGDIYRARNKLALAREQFESCLKIRRELSDGDRSNYRWRRDLAVAITRLAELDEVQGKLQSALEGYRASLEIRLGLVAKDASNTVWQQGVALQHYYIARVLKQLGENSESTASYLKCAKLWSSLGHRPEYAADCYTLAGDKEEAFAQLRKAFDQGTSSPAQAKENPDLQELHEDPRWAELVK